MDIHPNMIYPQFVMTGSCRICWQGDTILARIPLLATLLADAETLHLAFMRALMKRENC